MKQSLLLLAMTTGLSLASHAQVVGGSAYMKGNLVELGIDNVGGFEGINVDTCPVPVGMHFRSNTQYFGFVANPQMDGWVNFDGDFFTPGSPENGWGLELVTGGVSTVLNNNLNNFMVPGMDIPGTVTSYTYISGTHTTVWEGTYNDSSYNVGVKIVYTLNDPDLYFSTEVTLTNYGPGTIDEVYYMRNLDPDNNVTLTGDYTTTNTIVSQSNTSGASCVTAEASTPWYSMVSFVSTDTNTRVCTGGFSNRDASDMYNGVSGLTGTVGYTNFSDEAIGMTYKAVNLADTATVPFRAGSHSRVSFSFKTVFDPQTLNDILGTVTNVAEITATDVWLYPNPATDVVKLQSKEKVKNITLYNALGDVVFTANNTNTIDISGFDAGVFILTATFENGTVYTEKLIKE